MIKVDSLPRKNMPVDFLHENVKRYRKMIKGEKVTHAPFRLWIDNIYMCQLTGVSLKDYSSDIETMLNVQKAVNKRFYDLIDYSVHLGTLDIYFDVDKFTSDNPNAHPYRFLESSLDNFDKYYSKEPIEKVKGVKDLTHAIEYFNKHLPPSKHANHYLGSCGMLDMYSIFRGTKEFFLDFYDNHAATKKIFDYFHERTLEWLEYIQKTWGSIESENNLYDKIDIGEDYCAYFPPDIFADFVQPYVGDIFDRYKDKVCCSLHTDGDFVTGGIKNLRMLPIDELMGFSPNIDIKEFRKALPDTILGGNIHPITVMVEGTEADVKAAAKYCFENANQNQRFVLCTGGGMSGETKPENIDAFLEAAYEIVKY